MTIDPRTYEKYSGRKGDPMMRKGAALAGQAARDSVRGAELERTGSERIMRGKLNVIKVSLFIGLIFGIIALIGLAFNL
ncbi:MAG: hypothetical protein IID31_11265 [Planctomycetes bacterium]|nr:hypothetical protein [Planctomycetota bacterium]